MENFKDSKKLAVECRDKAEKARKESIYLNAIKLYNSDSVTEIKKSVEEFNKIVDYKDANDKIRLSEEKLKELEIQQEAAYLKKKKEDIINLLYFADFINNYCRLIFLSM